MTTPTPRPAPVGTQIRKAVPVNATGMGLNGTLKRRRRNWLQAGNGRRSSAPSRSSPTPLGSPTSPTRRLEADIPLGERPPGERRRQLDAQLRGHQPNGVRRRVGIVGTQRDDGRETRRVITIHSRGADLKTDTARQVAAALIEVADELDQLG
jgi:hypothetical protein